MTRLQLRRLPIGAERLDSPLSPAPVVDADSGYCSESALSSGPVSGVLVASGDEEVAFRAPAGRHQQLGIRTRPWEQPGLRWSSDPGGFSTGSTGGLQVTFDNLFRDC